MTPSKAARAGPGAQPLGDVLCGIDAARSAYEAVRQGAALAAPGGHLTLLAACAARGSGHYRAATLGEVRGSRSVRPACRARRSCSSAASPRSRRIRCPARCSSRAAPRRGALRRTHPGGQRRPGPLRSASRLRGRACARAILVAAAAAARGALGVCLAPCPRGRAGRAGPPRARSARQRARRARRRAYDHSQGRRRGARNSARAEQPPHERSACARQRQRARRAPCRLLGAADAARGPAGRSERICT